MISLLPLRATLSTVVSLSKVSTDFQWRKASNDLELILCFSSQEKSKEKERKSLDQFLLCLFLFEVKLKKSKYSELSTVNTVKFKFSQLGLVEEVVVWEESVFGH